MIYCLTGELLYLDAVAMTAVIDCAGVGYKLTVSGSCIRRLSTVEKSEKVRVFTYMAVREDAVELYGFSSKEELDTFKMLISVSGVGPKAGISILSVLTPDALAQAIGAGDAKAISQAPGVGGKTAARIVLELKDKMAKAFFTGENADATEASGTTQVPRGGNVSDARDALIVLGYNRNEIAEALRGLSPKTGTEELIRLALAKLMKQ